MYQSEIDKSRKICKFDYFCYLWFIKLLQLVEHPHLHLQPLPYQGHLVSSIFSCQVFLALLFTIRIDGEIHRFAGRVWVGSGGFVYVAFGWKGCRVVVAAILRGMAYFHLQQWIILQLVLIVVDHQGNAKMSILSKQRSSLHPRTHTVHWLVASTPHSWASSCHRQVGFNGRHM